MNFTESSDIVLRPHAQAIHSRLHVLFTICSYVLIFWICLPAFLLVTGFRLDQLLPVQMAVGPGMKVAGSLLLFAGAALMAASMGQLWFQGRGLPISHLPPSEFVAVGIYKYLRHPIYVGYTIAFAGLSVLLNSFWSLTFSTALLVALWIAYALFYEEPALTARFENTFAGYQQTTALLLPRKLSAPFARLLRHSARWFSRPLDRMANWTIMYQRGELILVTYGAFVTVGAFLFMYLSSSILMAQGVTTAHTVFALLLGGFCILFFARFFWWAAHWREMIGQPMFGIRQIGFVSFGGFFGWCLFAVIFSLIYDYSLLMIFDSVVRGMFIAWTLGRLGCLTYGCCYGLESKTSGILLYTDPESKVVRERGPQHTPRHATQLYAFAKNLFFLIFVNTIVFWDLPAGFVTAITFILYAVARSYVEFLRDRRRYKHVFTGGHICCAVMFVTGWLLLLFLSPTIGAASPKPLTLDALYQGLVLVPLIAFLSLVGFVATSLHWKKIGTL
ncbi:MAG TPA: prolipoprotein diacylglyceryl transferase family protein [Pyrinomonadaceae bacterium]|nr:prolipoprotein diacylglyceryl transferase family protein [Pyrinomonadaceae bacterium]